MGETLARILARTEALVKWRWVFFAVAVVVFFALRVSFLRSDPPPKMFHGYSTIELIAEPAAKASEARNYALFGSFVPNEVDNYQFWRPQSPVWVYPLAGVYRLFGVSYATLRLFALSWSFVGLLALLGTARRYLAPAAFAAFAIFAVLDHVDATYGRSGLLEPAVGAALSVGIAALVRARDRVWWLIPSMIAFFAAFFVKQAAITAFPTLLAFGVAALWRAPGVEKKWRARAIILVVAAALLALLVVLVTRVDYQRAVTWNYNHVLVGKGNNSRDIDVDDVLDGNVIAGWEVILHRLQGIGTIFLVTFPLAVWSVVTTVTRWVRERELDWVRGVFSLWFVSTFIALFVTKPTGIRFLLLLWPSCLFLAAAKIDDWVRAPSPRRAALALGAMLIHTVYQIVGVVFVAVNARYAMVELGQRLQQQIGPRDDVVVIGHFAAPAVLETPYRHYYVKEVFNSSPETLAALHVTHVLLRTQGRDITGVVLAKSAPQLLRGKELWRAPIFRNYEVVLSEVPRSSRMSPSRGQLRPTNK